MTVKTILCAREPSRRLRRFAATASPDLEFFWTSVFPSVSAQLGAAVASVFRWRTRYQEQGLAGLADRPQNFKISNDRSLC